MLGVTRIDCVRAGNNADIATVHLSVDANGTGNNVGVARLPRIQPRTVNGNRSLLDGHPVEAVTVHHWPPGGQHAAIRVDEAAAITVNTGRVRHHDIGPPPRYFNPALELARVG